jgi:hypothetical protein
MLISLAKDLQKPKENLQEFADITNRVLSHIENVITAKRQYRDYFLLVSESGGTKKYIRPINSNIFIFNKDEFNKQFYSFISLLKQISDKKSRIVKEQNNVIDTVVYTIQQSIGMGLDLLVESNSAKKHVGNRFEELIRSIINELGISNKKVILKIPYSKNNYYRCETDLIISPYDDVQSNSSNVHPKEIVLSLKTTSKDRMSKIFIDKLLMKKFVKHDVKVVGIFLNDVQRKQDNKISYTLVSNLFMVYTKFLTKLEGVYYVDVPPRAKESNFRKHIFHFSKFLTEDIWKLIKL